VTGNQASKPVKAVSQIAPSKTDARSVTSKHTTVQQNLEAMDQMAEKLQEHIMQGLENDWIDIDSDNVSDYELDAVESMMSQL
jgi:hypothetical protein